MGKYKNQLVINEKLEFRPMLFCWVRKSVLYAQAWQNEPDSKRRGNPVRHRRGKICEFFCAEELDLQYELFDGYVPVPDCEIRVTQEQKEIGYDADLVGTDHKIHIKSYYQSQYRESYTFGVNDCVKLNPTDADLICFVVLSADEKSAAIRALIPAKVLNEYDLYSYPALQAHRHRIRNVYYSEMLDRLSST